MLEDVSRVNMDYMVRLASEPGWAKNREEAIHAYNLEHGARYGSEPIPTYLKPLFISHHQHALLERAADHLLGALNRFIDLWLEDEELQGLWNVSDAELDLYKVDPGYPGAIQVARFDGFLEEDRLKFLEFNCDSPGGAGYGDVMDQAFEEALLSDPRFEDWADLRTTRHQPALARTLEACYAAWRANGNAERPERPRVVITDWHDVTSLPDIQITTEALTAWGMDIEFADPRKLELDGDTLVKDSRPVDLVYKRAITKELVQEPDAQALLTAYEAGTVCMVNSPRSPIVGNKKIMAVIQEPSILSRLSPAQRAAVKRFLPWTAILREGKTTIQGYKVDLGEFVRHNKDKLVLKPAQSYGGKDVYLGQDTEEEAWQRLVDENIGDNTWVVQEMVKIPKELFPVIEEDEVTMRLLNVNINPFVFGGTFAGAYTRISRSNVINVASGGGIVPTKTIEPLDDGEL